VAAGSEGGVCPTCGVWAEDYQPGVSAVKVDGVWYHPSCAILEGLAIGEAEEHADQEQAAQ
jgi:hypothetical protein